VLSLRSGRQGGAELSLPVSLLSARPGCEAAVPQYPRACSAKACQQPECQHCTDRLWQCRRDTGTVPHALRHCAAAVQPALRLQPESGRPRAVAVGESDSESPQSLKFSLNQDRLSLGVRVPSVTVWDLHTVSLATRPDVDVIASG